MGGHAELRNSTAVARVEQRLWPAVGGKIERFFRPPFPLSPPLPSGVEVQPLHIA